MVDTYLSYMTAAERAAWCHDVVDKGLDTTVRQASFPASLWYTDVNGYGVKTPQGPMTTEQYVIYVREGEEATERLRDYANRFPPPGAITEPDAVGELSTRSPTRELPDSLDN